MSSGQTEKRGLPLGNERTGSLIQSRHNIDGSLCRKTNTQQRRLIVVPSSTSTRESAQGGHRPNSINSPATWGRNRPILPVKPLWLPSSGPQNNIGPLINEDCRPAQLRGDNKLYPRKFDPPPPKYAPSQNAFWQTVVDQGGLIKVEGALDPKPV